MSKTKTFLTILGILGTYQLLWKLRQKLRKLPDGPSDLMMIYYLLKTFLIKKTFDPLYMVKQVSNNYGKNGVIYHNLFIFHIIQITNSQMAKKILNHKNALDRPSFHNKNTGLQIDIESTKDGTKPFANINGKEWEQRRKLATSILFRMCTQSKFLNKIVQETMINVVFKELDKLIKKDELWYPHKLMKYCAYNTIAYANIGEHMDINDELYIKSVKLISEVFGLFKSGIIYAMLPRYIMLLVRMNPRSDYHKIVKVIKKREILAEQMEQRRYIASFCVFIWWI